MLVELTKIVEKKSYKKSLCLIKIITSNKTSILNNHYSNNNDDNNCFFKQPKLNKKQLL